ncbi:MAG TPA: shikimate dehydrogenase [Thermodesulfobacteriota bacterium]|nr:shikimate dehydrogenase [Thermodesulfobacteriota bacterium]
MEIKATTQIYGIFGHPVSHSLSPVMHNSAFSTLGLDCVYVAFDIAPEEMGKAAQSVRTLGIKGINITIPHKESIIPHLDGIAPDAELTGAVNTVKNDAGNLSGYNTDVGGFLKAVEEDLGIKPEGASVLLIGAGGAARAVMSAFCMNGAERICIANRTNDKALKLASEFGKQFKKIKIEPVALDDRSAIKARLGEADILVNSTSAAMEGKTAIDLPLESLKESASVYDLVYKPRETPLVKEARRLGHRASGGLGMLLYQGALSFEIWTGMQAPVEVMRKAIE